MLPRSIYQLLPYLYISLGLFCMVIVDSHLIFFSSALLIAAGVLVLWMRQMKSVASVKYRQKSKIRPEEELALFVIDEAGFPDHERRIEDDRDFPLVDDDGVLIPFDRRNHEPDMVS